MASVNAAKQASAVGGEEQSDGDSRIADASRPEQARGPRIVSVGALAGGRRHQHRAAQRGALLLCWLDWEAGDYYRAAVLGDFLARRYPDHPAAAASAKLALASYEQLLQAAAQNRNAGRGHRVRSPQNGRDRRVHDAPLARYAGGRNGPPRADFATRSAAAKSTKRKSCSTRCRRPRGRRWRHNSAMRCGGNTCNSRRVRVRTSRRTRN